MHDEVEHLRKTSARGGQRSGNVVQADTVGLQLADQPDAVDLRRVVEAVVAAGAFGRVGEAQARVVIHSAGGGPCLRSQFTATREIAGPGFPSPREPNRGSNMKP